MPDPIDIGSRRELFLDDYLIDQLTDATQHLHPPIRREVVSQVQKPLENACTGCYNLTQDGDRILMYYRGFYPIGEQSADMGEKQTTNLLISHDGITFEQPDVRNMKDNVVQQGIQSHNFCVFLDKNPETPPEQRFKAVGGVGKDDLHGFVSPDGLQWSPIQDGPLDITGAFDSVNVPFWDPHASCYRIFSRYFDETTDNNVRAIQSCTSDDFIHWTKPKPHIYDESLPLEHFYTNATMPCPGAEHILVSFPMRFFPKREKDTDHMDYPGPGVSDAVFISSRDGVHWSRTFPEAWIRPGLDQKNWTHRNCTPAVGIIETSPDEWSMYIAEHYGWSTNRLRRIAIRPHGFASIRTGYFGGEMVTNPLTFSGNTLHLNYATSAGGSIGVEIQDATGTPIPGFTLNDMEPIYGDQLDEPITWKGHENISSLTGTPVRFRFVMKDADLFALRVAE